ncbi:hypothetical protein NDU88_000432, partial [Pleurodeles waltl]
VQIPLASVPLSASQDTSTPDQDQAFSEDSTPASLDDREQPCPSGQHPSEVGHLEGNRK